MSNRYMKDKQKVTLYVPPELHRQLKIQSAVDSEPMSAIAERALMLYLEHPEALQNLEHGHTHQIHSCPKCRADFILRDGEAIAVSSHPASAAIADSVHIIDDVAEEPYPTQQERDPEQLVPC
ncbi:MAG: hypothetical protein WBA10_14700 [Elainellaceae cyanobacterium]